MKPTFTVQLFTLTICDEEQFQFLRDSVNSVRLRNIHHYGQLSSEAIAQLHEAISRLSFELFILHWLMAQLPVRKIFAHIGIIEAGSDYGRAPMQIPGSNFRIEGAMRRWDSPFVSELTPEIGISELGFIAEMDCIPDVIPDLLRCSQYFPTLLTAAIARIVPHLAVDTDSPASIGGVCAIIKGSEVIAASLMESTDRLLSVK